MPSPIARQRAILALQDQLEARGFPRLQMVLFLAISASAAFLTSFVLLRAGWGRMGPRYAVAALVAYGSLLVLLRGWLWATLRGRGAAPARPTEAPDGLDALDIVLMDGGLEASPPGGHAAAAAPFGEGGGFGGGGASRSFGSTGAGAGRSAPHPGSGSSGSASGGGFDLPDLDDGAVLLLPIIAVVALIAVLGAAATVVTSAPALFAELLADGLIAAGAYRHLRRSAARSWLFGAVRRTGLMAVAVMVIAWGTGAAIQWVAPTARSIGDTWRLPRAAREARHPQAVRRTAKPAAPAPATKPTTTGPTGAPP